MRSAAADIAVERLDDFSRVRAGIVLEQRDAAHDHSGRAVSALKGSGIDESLLHRMELAVALEAFDRYDGFCCCGADRNLAGASWAAANQNGAGAALAFAATVLGAGEAELVAQNLEQRRFRVEPDIVSPAVDFELELRRHTEHCEPRRRGMQCLRGVGRSPMC